MADAVEKPRRKTHSKGFLAANLVVVAGFLGVLVLFAMLVSRGTSNGWSSYKPKGGDVFSKAQNMADHVAPAYKYNGEPIAVVQAQPLLYQDAVVDGIAFTRQPFRKIGTPFKQFEPSGSTIAYVFCGSAPRCGLPTAGAQDPVPLLRRETLELALYTFKYSPSVDSIVGLLPPASGSANYAIYLRRRNFEKELRSRSTRRFPAQGAQLPAAEPRREGDRRPPDDEEHVPVAVLAGRERADAARARSLGQ